MKLFIQSIKSFSISYLLAVVGLAVAYAVFYMTVVQTTYDLSFDTNFEKADSIYLYSRIMPNMSDSWRIITNTVEPRECAERYSEIKNFCYLMFDDCAFELKNEHTGELQMIDGMMTSASIGFIDMFQPKVLQGDVKQAFIPGNAMLTESVAKKIFRDQYPVGETVQLHRDDKLTVAAVCADFPDNCSLKNGIFVYQPEGYPQNWDYTTYFEIAPSHRGQLLKRMNDEQYMQKGLNRPDEVWQYELTALPDVHLWFPAKGEGSLVSVISLLTVGILLLVISYINFLNFSFAMAPARVKTINIRKILGENAFMIKLSVAMETVLLSFVSFVVSIVFIQILNTGAVKDFFGAGLAISENTELLVFSGAVSILLGLLAGIYPAVYTTSFRPAMALSGTFFHFPHHKGMKNMLAGVQYTTAIFLIVTTVFIKLQYDYLRNKNWGIQTENVLYFNTMSNRMNVDNAMIELNRNPNIIDITAAAHFPGQEQIMNWGRMIDSIRVSMKVWAVKPDFFDFFGIQVVEGERFKVNDSEKMILNRAFSKEYDLNDVLRKSISGHEVIGIVKDFNFNSLHGDIQPLAFIPIDDKNKGRYYNWIFVKTQGANTEQTIEYIRDTWKKFSDEPSEILLLNETIQSLYQREYNFASLVSICGMIAIAVAMTGLYGLTLFDSKTQRRNIAIRKVYGASKTDILLMLNQGRLLQFAVSCLVAFPLSYYAVQRWLENFAYKTPVCWWVFILGSGVVLAISLLTVSWESYKAASDNPAEVLKT